MILLIVAGLVIVGLVWAINRSRSIDGKADDGARSDLGSGEPLSEPRGAGFTLDYDQSIHLDAEDLAEGGIGEAYRTRVLPRLRQYVTLGGPIENVIDQLSGDHSRYVVRAGDREHVVYSSEIDTSAGESWGRAAVALFTIVNDQLEGSTHRFYAIGGGNDLSGMFLTPSEAESARRALTDKTDWPYLPVLEDPWYGQRHD